MKAFSVRIHEVEADSTFTRILPTLELRQELVANVAQRLFNEDEFLQASFPNEDHIGEIIDIVFEGGITDDGDHTDAIAHLETHEENL